MAAVLFRFIPRDLRLALPREARRNASKWHSRRSLQVPRPASCVSHRAAAALEVRSHFGPSLRPLHTSPWLQEIVAFKLSDIGEGIGEVTIKEWYVKVGEKVSQFDSICEVQSDKASVTITSRYDGRITKLYHEVDDLCKVGSPLVDIEVDDESLSSSDDDEVHDQDIGSSQRASKPAPESVVQEAGGTPGDKVLTTPAVRRIAMENNIPLSDVKGTGKDGRVLKEDVIRYIELLQTPKPTATPAKAAPTPAPSQGVKPAAVERKRPRATPLKAAEDRVEPVRGIRRAMAKTMAQSLAIPHFGYCDEVDVTRLVQLRPILRPFAEREGLRLSYMPFFMKALSISLLEYPTLNAYVDDNVENMTIKGCHHVGIAMDTPHGLLVPVVKNVESKSILEIAADLNQLQELGNSGRLQQDDLTGATIVLSNIGTVGGTYAHPIITKPMVLIGAIGAIKPRVALTNKKPVGLGKKQPRFDEEDNLTKAHILQVSWSADHRVIDGATVSRFSNLWKTYLETPALMLVHLK